MVCLLPLGPQRVSHCRSPRTAHAHIHLIRPAINSGRPVRGASQQEQFQWRGVVPPLLAPQRAWTSSRRGANCVADSHNGLGESTVALQNPGSEQPVAYVLGVPSGDQALADVNQQLTQLLQHLQRQQHNQHQQLLVLWDSAAAAHTTSGAAAAATDTQLQHSSDEEPHQLQQQLADLVAAYGGQLQVLPEQQQQAALGDTVPASAAAPATRSGELGDLGGQDDEDGLAVLMARLAAKQPPPDVLRAAAEEAEKLRRGGEMQPGAAEARAYLELLASLPWSSRAWEELEQQPAVRSKTAPPPEQQQQQEAILGDNDAFLRLIEKQRGPYRASDAEQKRSSSSSSDMGALLLSGLGQAGRAAAGAATVAAGAVRDVIEGAAMATVAALAAYDQRGVEVAADLPDTSLRPSTAVDWRQSPEDGQLSWQAALTFCALLIQLENAGYDVVITGGEDDEDSNDASQSGAAADGDDDSAGSSQERVLRALIESGVVDDIPDGSVVRVVLNTDGDVGIEVISLPGAADAEGSGTTHLQKLLADGATPEQLVQAWPELREHPVLKGHLDSAESDKDQQQQQEGTGDGATAAAEEGDSSDHAFTPLGMRIGDDGKVFLLGVDRNGNIRAKEEPTKPGGSSKEGSKAHSDCITNNSSSNGAAAGLSLDALLEAGRLPLSTSSSSKVSGADASSNDSSSADAAAAAAAAEGSGPDSNSSSKSTIVGDSSSAAEGNPADQASTTNAAAAADTTAESSAAEEQSAVAEKEASGLGPVDLPKALSSSDAIHLLKKEFRRRVSSATQSSDDDDVTAAAAADSSTGSDDDNASADDDVDSRSDQQRESASSAIARSSADLSLSDDDDDDRLAVRTNSPELLAAMLQLERSWHSSSSSGGDGSSSSGGSSVLKQPPSGAGSAAAPPAAAAGDPNSEAVPELLPRPLRPPQPEQHSSSSGADPSGNSRTADTEHSSSSSRKQTGLTKQEAAEVQSIINDTRAAAADLPRDAAAARLRSRRNKQRQQLQQQQGKQGSTNTDATSSSSKKADQPVSSSSSNDGSSARLGQGSASAQASVDSDSDSDSDVDVTDLFQQFAAKLEAEGVFLDEDEKIALFVDLYGEDSDGDSDADSGDDESEGDDESAGDQSSATAASSSSGSSSKEGGSEGTSSKDSSSSSSSGGSSSSNVRAAAAGDVIRSRRSRDSSSSSNSKVPLPGGPGWDQLGRMVGGESLSKLRDLLRSGNVRLSGLNTLELGILLQGLSRLQQGESLDSEEISLLLRFINEAEITPEGDEQHPDEKLKRRNKVLRRQQQQSRAGFKRSASSRASTLGFGVGIKDKAYVQDTRSLRVPKPAGSSRGEQVKQLLRQLRAERQQREFLLLHRQALQYARLQLSATLEVNVDQDAVDGTRVSSSSSSDGSSTGKDSGAPSDVQHAAAEYPTGGGADAVPGVRNSSKDGSSSGWRAALKGLGSVFGKADAKLQCQQQQPAAQQQQQRQSSSTSVSNSDQRMHSIDHALSEQQQQALQARSTLLIQQLQHVLAEPAGTGLGTTPAADDAAGANAKRVVVAVVPLDQLEFVRQQWDKATSI